jgi:hypothetical protein
VHGAIGEAGDPKVKPRRHIHRRLNRSDCGAVERGSPVLTWVGVECSAPHGAAPDAESGVAGSGSSSGNSFDFDHRCH